MTQTPLISEEIPSLGLLARLKQLRENKEFERFWKFAVVGLIGAVIDFGTFSFLRKVGWLDETTIQLPIGTINGLGIAGTIAFLLAVISNFIWNRYWTYPDSRSKSLLSQLVTFFAINIVGIFIRIPVLQFLSPIFGNLALSVLPFFSEQTAIWLGENLAWASSVILVMFWNFFVNRYWTYNDVE